LRLKSDIASGYPTNTVNNTVY